MNAFFVNLLNLFRLRGGPQEFPSSGWLAIFLVGGYLLQNLITGTQLDDENAAAKSILAISLQIIVLAGLLYWRRRPERFLQSLSALAAVGIVFNFMTRALLVQVDGSGEQPIFALILFALFFWSLFVDANIYRHALSVTLSIGVLISVLLLAASYAFIEILFL